MGVVNRITVPENNFEFVIGRSPVMNSMFEMLKVVADAEANVLITGESGSGKELVARSLHKFSSRASKHFVPLNCTAIPEHLLESELFGHVRGSFTGAISDQKGLFEEANGGTLFLDEIGDLNLALQAKLLRVLQDKQIRAVGGCQLKTIDVRIITATHRDLRQMVSDGKFREDLFYRLNVIPLPVPPLRERKEDIPALIEQFLKKYSNRNHLGIKRITVEALNFLSNYSWPGNVRELENTIERAMILCRGEWIDVADFKDLTTRPHNVEIPILPSDRPTLEKLEERYIKLIMNEVDNKKDEAARVLGISRRTLYRKERLYGMAP